MSIDMTLQKVGDFTMGVFGEIFLSGATAFLVKLKTFTLIMKVSVRNRQIKNNKKSCRQKAFDKLI